MNRIRLIQAISEAIIPILGVFYFNWGLYFILLFYFIDLIASEVFVYIKVNKIIQFQRINFSFQLRYGRLIFNSLLVLLIIIAAHFVILLLSPTISLYEEFVEFIMYEDTGIPIPQGIILLPLVIFGNLQQYKAFFIKNGRYRMSSWKELVFMRRKVLYLTLIGIGLGLVLAYFIVVPAMVYILGIVVVKFWIDLKWG